MNTIPVPPLTIETSVITKQLPTSIYYKVIVVDANGKRWEFEGVKAHYNCTPVEETK